MHREHKVKRENQQDATNYQTFYLNMFRASLYPSSVCTVHTAHDAAPQGHSHPQPTHPGRTPYTVIHGLILLMMGIMMPETC